MSRLRPKFQDIYPEKLHLDWNQAGIAHSRAMRASYLGLKEKSDMWYRIAEKHLVPLINHLKEKGLWTN